MTITCDIHKGVALITLDDGKVNAMNPGFFDGLHRALDDASDARSVIITGRPGRFSAGLDIRHVPTLGPDAMRDFARDFGRLMLRVFNLPIPTVAAINGHAIAGGAILACACDLRLGLEGPFTFYLNEVEIGIPLPSWAIAIAETATPISWRAPFILHAQRLTHVEAAKAGILHATTSDVEGLLEEARRRAGRALNLGAYRISKARARERNHGDLAQRVEEETLDFNP